MDGELSTDDVVYIARLARLELSGEELERFTGQLAAVLEHVEAVRRLDTTGVEPTAHALELVNVLRPDVVVPGLERDEVLAAAPASEDHRFKVPSILGETP